MRWLDVVRTRLGLVFGRRTVESRMNKELRLHIDLEAERLMREQDLSPLEARRRAMAAFGGVERHKETMRAGRGLAWLGALNLGAAIAFGVAAGVGTFQLRTQVVNPTLPLDEGSRIVGLRIWDTSRNRPAPPGSTDFGWWRDGLRLVKDVSACRVFQRNLITPDGQARVEAVAAMSAAAFYR